MANSQPQTLVESWCDDGSDTFEAPGLRVGAGVWVVGVGVAVVAVGVGATVGVRAGLGLGLELCVGPSGCRRVGAELGEEEACDECAPETCDACAPDTCE